jgi:8-oxo-dGTP pyrophosphatase MutT (NUDIX family)
MSVVFGFFCTEDAGEETILVRSNADKNWAFPINVKFEPSSQTVDQVIDDTILELCTNQTLFNHLDLLTSGLKPPIIQKILIGPEPAEVRTQSRQDYNAFFCKIQFDTQMPLLNPAYTWVKKASIFADAASCQDKDLLVAIKRDYIYPRYGFRVLECVDMLVFRVKNDRPEFLMLKREDERLAMIGWEYPKGGIQFHESLREGALRELLEETGVAKYRFKGYLGHQVVDVSERKRIWYDTLCVHGLTYQFVGEEGQIDSHAPRERLRTPTWMSWEEAREKVWMKSYGPEFFDRWNNKRAEILEGLI